MSEPDFEAQLAQLYRNAPILPDEREFLHTLEARIELEVRRRRSVLAGCGLIGACVSFAALSDLDALPWPRLAVAHLFQAFERLLTSIEIVHFAALGGVMVVALAMRELNRIVSESPD